MSWPAGRKYRGCHKGYTDRCGWNLGRFPYAAASRWANRGATQQYRFAAAEIADEAFRSKAISLVLAGGVVSAVFGAEVAKWSRDLFEPVLFAGCYALILVLFLASAVLLYFVELPRPARPVLAGGGRPLREIATEPSASGMSLIPMLKEQTHLDVVGRKSNVDKVTRMSRQQGRFEAGRILLPTEALWLPRTSSVAPGGTLSWPLRSTTLTCRKASPAPSGSCTNPNPLSGLYHLTTARTGGPEGASNLWAPDENPKLYWGGSKLSSSKPRRRIGRKSLSLLLT